MGTEKIDTMAGVEKRIILERVIELEQECYCLKAENQRLESLYREQDSAISELRHEVKVANAKRDRAIYRLKGIEKQKKQLKRSISVIAQKQVEHIVKANEEAVINIECVMNKLKKGASNYKRLSDTIKKIRGEG